MKRLTGAPGRTRSTYPSPSKSVLAKRSPRPDELRGNDGFPWDSFDTDRYVEKNYSSVRDDDRSILEQIRDFFASELAGGSGARRGIDVGCGPNLYPALAMLPFCDEIALWEHSATNRSWLWRELKGYSASWDEFWATLAKITPYDQIMDPRNALRDRARVINGDVFKLSPRQPFDVGTMFFVAESISAREREFQLATQRFIGALRPGAPFAAAFMRNSTGYLVGADRFPAVAINEVDVEHCLSSIAYDVEISDVKSENLRDGYDGMMLALGKAGRAKL